MNSEAGNDGNLLVLSTYIFNYFMLTTRRLVYILFLYFNYFILTTARFTLVYNYTSTSHVLSPSVKKMSKNQIKTDRNKI